MPDKNCFTPVFPSLSANPNMCLRFLVAVSLSIVTAVDLLASQSSTKWIMLNVTPAQAQAVLVAATAALGCLLVAQFSQLTRGVPVSQAALVARVDWPPPDATAPWFPDPHQHWHGGGYGSGSGSGY